MCLLKIEQVFYRTKNKAQSLDQSSDLNRVKAFKEFCLRFLICLSFFGLLTACGEKSGDHAPFFNIESRNLASNRDSNLSSVSLSSDLRGVFGNELFESLEEDLQLSLNLSNNLINSEPKDIDVICPSYTSLQTEGRLVFWSNFFYALVLDQKVEVSNALSRLKEEDLEVLVSEESEGDLGPGIKSTCESFSSLACVAFFFNNLENFEPLDYIDADIRERLPETAVCSL